MLKARLFSTRETASPQAVFRALNDVVVARGAIARLIRVEASIDGEAFTSYRADGVILATATGSTGYALATGGPVLYPQCRDWLLSPILPHVGSHHKLVLSPSSRVRLELFTTHQATLSVDGHINIPLDDGVVLEVGLSEKVTRFLRLKPPHEFYSRLVTKLGGQKS
jgi:NAD+ kinase